MHSQAKTVLLVEDDPALALGLCDALTFEGFEVFHATTGSQGVQLSSDKKPDCVILDLMLPDINGFDACKLIREKDKRVPILMLTARSSEADKIRGLDAGADDYVTKPFSVGELVARIRAIFRRASRVNQDLTLLKLGEWEIDLGAHLLKNAKVSIALSFYEVELLRLLYERKGQPVSRDEILERIWGIKAGPTNRTVDNFVMKLRKKIEPLPDKPSFILTVYGFGYKLVSDSQ